MLIPARNAYEMVAADWRRLWRDVVNQEVVPMDRPTTDTAGKGRPVVQFDQCQSSAQQARHDGPVLTAQGMGGCSGLRWTV